MDALHIDGRTLTLQQWSEASSLLEGINFENMTLGQIAQTIERVAILLSCQ